MPSPARPACPSCRAPHDRRSSRRRPLYTLPLRPQRKYGNLLLPQRRACHRHRHRSPPGQYGGKIAESRGTLHSDRGGCNQRSGPVAGRPPNGKEHHGTCEKGRGRGRQPGTTRGSCTPEGVTGYTSMRPYATLPVIRRQLSRQIRQHSNPGHIRGHIKVTINYKQYIFP